MTTQPIDAWMKLIVSELSDAALAEGLREIYADHPPTVAEIILSGFCPNRCMHCIYPPDYHRFYKPLTRGQWAQALRTLYNVAGLKKYIFCGRCLAQEHLSIIQRFRDDCPDLELGVIGDGDTLLSLSAQLSALAPNWIDISLDGLEKEHDTQRNNPGSFKRTLTALQHLRDSEACNRINILTCLTAVNMHSVLSMVRLLNQEGFKNFFITPISILKGVRPAPALQPDLADFARLVSEVAQSTGELADSWVEIDIFEVIYARALKQHLPELFRHLAGMEEHLELTRKQGDNEFHLCYYPTSLTGVRELIVNLDGNIIPPKVMGMGRVPEEYSFGKVFAAIKDRSGWQDLWQQPAFSFYVMELKEEKAFLQ